MKFSARRVAILVLAAAVGLGGVACAAKGLRNKMRVAALTGADLSVDISRQERELYKTGVPGYDKAAHDRVGEKIEGLLYASRGFERAARAWREGEITPAAVDDARVAFMLAIDDLQKALPPIALVRDTLSRSLAALKAYLAKPTEARLPLGEPLRSQELPPASVLTVLAMVSAIVKALAAGKTTLATLWENLRRAGVRDDELDAADLRLTDEIRERQKDHAPT